MSNYHSFGAMKFVPELASFEVFAKILYSHHDCAKPSQDLKSLLDLVLP